MSASSVDYHRDAIVDIRSAVAWYQQRSPKAALDFIEELNRATSTIRELPSAGQVEKTIPEDSCFGGSLSRSFIHKRNLQSQSGRSLTAADDRITGHIGSEHIV